MIVNCKKNNTKTQKISTFFFFPGGVPPLQLVNNCRRRHEDKPDDRVGPVPGLGGRVHGRGRPRVRRPGPAAVHPGHAAAADAVVPDGRAGRPVGRQRVQLAAQQGAADGDQRAGTRETVQIHVRHGPRGGICRATATG